MPREDQHGGLWLLLSATPVQMSRHAQQLDVLRTQLRLTFCHYQLVSITTQKKAYVSNRTWAWKQAHQSLLLSGPICLFVAFVLTGTNVLRWKRRRVYVHGGIFKSIFLQGQRNGEYQKWSLTSADLRHWCIYSLGKSNRAVLSGYFGGKNSFLPHILLEMNQSAKQWFQAHLECI